MSITPFTPDGMLTGPGVDESTITLGLLVDPERDRGFSDGVRLWRNSVNTEGGLCGRSVELLGNDSEGLPEGISEAAVPLARSSLGLIWLPAAGEVGASPVDAAVIPTLAPGGISARLGPTEPIVVGPTEDILTINALEYVAERDQLGEGSAVGVVTDGGAAAANAVSGAEWWSAERGIPLIVRSTNTDQDLAPWDASVRTVLVLADAATVQDILLRTDPTTTIVTTVDGYDPAQWSAEANDAASGGRVLVAVPTPAFGSEETAIQVVTDQFAAAEGADPGPRLLTGYATAETWARLINQACSDLELTRSAIAAAAVSAGPAPSGALFEGSDTALVVESGLPATRASAVAVGSPTAPTGLQPLTGLLSASGIDDYVP